MAYTCAMDRNNKKFIFLILPVQYSSQMQPGYISWYTICLETFMNVSMASFSNTEKVSTMCVKTMVESCENNVFTCFEILSYASYMLLYASVTLTWFTVFVYILTLL